MCCGQQRSELKAGGSVEQGELSLRYFGSAPVSVQGPVTGRLYQFSRVQPTQAVDARDAASILRTRLFRQVR